MTAVGLVFRPSGLGFFLFLIPTSNDVGCILSPLRGSEASDEAYS